MFWFIGALAAYALFLCIWPWLWAKTIGVYAYFPYNWRIWLSPALTPFYFDWCYKNHPRVW